MISMKKIKLPTLKDGNWNDKIYISEEKVPEHLRQLARDCAFLRDHNLMDYSLLLGIVLDKKPNDASSSSTKITLEGDYVFGIIDILQEWNWKKQGEQFLKRFCRGHVRDYKKLSAVEPEYYSRRFALRVLGCFHYDKAKKRKLLLQTLLEAANEPTEPQLKDLKPKKKKDRTKYQTWMSYFRKLEHNHRYA